jgi:hypothetical protein
VRSRYDLFEATGIECMDRHTRAIHRLIVLETAYKRDEDDMVGCVYYSKCACAWVYQVIQIFIKKIYFLFTLNGKILLFFLVNLRTLYFHFLYLIFKVQLSTEEFCKLPPTAWNNFDYRSLLLWILCPGIAVYTVFRVMRYLLKRNKRANNTYVVAQQHTVINHDNEKSSFDML